MWLYLAIIFIIVYLIVTYYLEKFEIDDIKKKSVFITGCDSGFGHLLALKLITNGATVFAGCLLESGEIELRKKAAKLPGKLVTIKLDVTKAESVRNALEIVTNETKETGKIFTFCLMIKINFFFMKIIQILINCNLIKLYRDSHFIK